MRRKALSARVKPIPAAVSWRASQLCPFAIELEAERTPGRHAQIDQAQLGVDEVEVIMQAFATLLHGSAGLTVLGPGRVADHSPFGERDFAGRWSSALSPQAPTGGKSG